MKDNVIVYREGFWQSVLADTYTFIVLLLSFYVNVHYVGSRFLTAIILVMFLLFVLGKSAARKHTFNDKEAAIAFLSQEKP